MAVNWLSDGTGKKKVVLIAYVKGGGKVEELSPSAQTKKTDVAFHC